MGGECRVTAGRAGAREVHGSAIKIRYGLGLIGLHTCYIRVLRDLFGFVKIVIVVYTTLKDDHIV